MYFHAPPPPPKKNGFDCCPFKGGDSVVVYLLYIVAPIVCGRSAFVPPFLFSAYSIFSSFAIGKRELIALYLNCLPDVSVSVLCLFLTVSWVSLQFVIVVLLDFSLTVKAAPHECVIRTSQP